MAEYVPPKINTQFIFYVALRSQADSTVFQVNPTIAAGDFKVSIDGGATANPGTLPAVTPAGGKAVKITLSASEMNGDNIFVYASDAAGAEWMDAAWNIQTGARQIVDLAFPTVSGRSIDTATTGEVGLDYGNVNLPAGPIPALGIIESGTMQAGSTATAWVLRAATSFADGLPVGATIIITGGTGAGQSRLITGWANATDTATVDTATTTPDNTSTYIVLGTAPASATALPQVDVAKWNSAAVAAPNVAGVPKVDLTHTLGTASAGAAGSVRADQVTGAVGSVTGAVGSVTGNVGGNVVGSVASVTANVNADVKKINGATVNGSGTAGDLWRG